MQWSKPSILKIERKMMFDKVEDFTICSSRLRVSSSNSALISSGSRSSSVVNERRQRFFGRYHAPYRYFLGDCPPCSIGIVGSLVNFVILELTCYEKQRRSIEGYFERKIPIPLRWISCVPIRQLLIL